MAIHAVLPWIAFGAMLILTFGSTFAREPLRHAYLLPAVLAAAFLAWSGYAVITAGPIGFLHEHIRNVWSNQIWFDILMAFAMAWLLVLKRMSAVCMQPLPWLVLFLCTGSFGLFAGMVTLPLSRGTFAWFCRLVVTKRMIRPSIRFIDSGFGN